MLEPNQFKISGSYIATPQAFERGSTPQAKPNQTKPTQAPPSQAKPNQTKPSQALFFKYAPPFLFEKLLKVFEKLLGSMFKASGFHVFNVTNISIKVTAKHFYKTNGSPKPGFKTFLSDSSIQYLLLRHKSRRLFLILSLQLWCRALPIYLLYYLCSCGAPRRRFFSYYLWSCGAEFLII